MGFWDEVKKQAELQKQNQKTISQRAAEKLEAEQSEKAKLKDSLLPEVSFYGSICK